jgi:hypothetical protein
MAHRDADSQERHRESIPICETDEIKYGLVENEGFNTKQGTGDI